MVNSIKGELQQLLVEKALVQGSSSSSVAKTSKSGSDKTCISSCNKFS